MKKILSLVTALIFALTLAISGMSVFAATVPYQVDIYTGGDPDGLSIRAMPTSDSEKIGSLIDQNFVTVTEVSDNGWGHINQGGADGWIYLQYTKIRGSYTADYPGYGYVSATNYRVTGTGNEGLELRVSPKVASSTFGPVPEGAYVTVTAICGDWAYASYNGNNGWLNINHLTVDQIAANFQASVFDTENEGLALKAAPAVGAVRYSVIPEGTLLTFDARTSTGWGRTNYNGTTGWVSLRYTKVDGSVAATAPSSGTINPTSYTLVNSANLRTNSTVESSTYGLIPEGTEVIAEAIVYDWAYVSYNGLKGWCNISNLKLTPEKPSDNYEDYIGYQYAGHDPWHGELAVTLRSLQDGKLSFTFTDSIENMMLYAEVNSVELKDGKGEFTAEGKVSAEPVEVSEGEFIDPAEATFSYKGTISLEGGKVVITFADGAIVTKSENGDSSAYQVGALIDAEKTVVLKKVEDSDLYIDYLGYQFAGKDPWGGELAVTIRTIENGELTFTYTDTIDKIMVYSEVGPIDFADGKGEFTVKGRVTDEPDEANSVFSYTGKIELKDGNVVITLTDGSIISNNGEGGAAYQVGPLSDDARVIVLTKNVDPDAAK